MPLLVDLGSLCVHRAERSAAALISGLPPTSPFFPSQRAGTGVRAVASTSSKINSNGPFPRRSRESSGVVSGTAFPPSWTNEFRERRAQEYQVKRGGNASWPGGVTPFCGSCIFVCAPRAPRCRYSVSRSGVAGLTPGCAQAPDGHWVMASEASAQAAQCCLHRLRFAEIEEFPDDEVDFSDILGGFAVGRCQALCRPCDGESVQIPQSWLFWPRCRKFL